MFSKLRLVCLPDQSYRRVSFKIELCTVFQLMLMVYHSRQITRSMNFLLSLARLGPSRPEEMYFDFFSLFFLVRLRVYRLLIDYRAPVDKVNTRVAGVV